MHDTLLEQKVGVYKLYAAYMREHVTKIFVISGYFNRSVCFSALLFLVDPLLASCGPRDGWLVHGVSYSYFRLLHHIRPAHYICILERVVLALNYNHKKTCNKFDNA